MSIADNIAAIRIQIAQTARDAGRNPNDILLCAATKMNDADRVRAAISAGVDCCGENRVQEFVKKHGEDAYRGAPVHFIGHLQTNKVRQVVGKVDLIQSVDSERPLLTAYIDMWSPLYVDHPRAISDKSPVPITKPLFWLAMSIRIWVRSRAWVFSYTVSRSSLGCPISFKWTLQASFISISFNEQPNVSINLTALIYVRLVVPKPGIVIAIIPFLSKPSLSNVLMQINKAKVESSPPDMPTTTLFA